jgi:hypothetical protein
MPHAAVRANARHMPESEPSAIPAPALAETPGTGAAGRVEDVVKTAKEPKDEARLRRLADKLGLKFKKARWQGGGYTISSAAGVGVWRSDDLAGIELFLNAPEARRNAVIAAEEIIREILTEAEEGPLQDWSRETRFYVEDQVHETMMAGMAGKLTPGAASRRLVAIRETALGERATA